MNNGPAVLARPAVVLALAVSLLTAGCVTSGTGEAMQHDIAQLNKRVVELEGRGAESKAQLERLKKVLDQATDLLTRNSADVGAKVARHDSDIALLNGKMEEAQHILDQIQKRQGELESGQQKIVDRVAPTIPEDKEALWKEAQSRMNGGLRDDARRFFKAFTDRFPQDPRAPEAQLGIGRAYVVDGKHTQAAAAFQKVLDAYPKAPEAPEAMFLLGQSFVQLKFCTDAKVLFQDLSKRYPKSPRASEARERIREVQKIARDKNLCTS